MPDTASLDMSWECEHCRVIHTVNKAIAAEAVYLYCDYCGAEHQITSVESVKLCPTRVKDVSELN